MGEQHRRQQAGHDLRDALIVEAVGIANDVQACVAGHKAPACAMAIGWVVGAVASYGTRGQADLDELITDIRRQAQIKFNGVRNGTWPDASAKSGRH